MREIIITRPRRYECSAMAMRIEVDGKHLAKLKNDKRIIMQLDEGAHTLRVHGGFLAGKRFQDGMKIPAGKQDYALQLDFVSDPKVNYLPVLRPFGGEHIKDDNRMITIFGSTLCKFLLEESVREALRTIPGASIKVMMLEKEWRVLLWHEGGGKILLRSEYYLLLGSFSDALISWIDRQQLATKDGREAVLEQVMANYVAWLPGYERQGKYGIVFKE
nr:hypothetical protein [Clostridia bacterium]